MRQSVKSLILMIATTAAFLLFAAWACAAQYTAIDLQGPTATSEWGTAYAINASGQIAGIWGNTSDPNMNMNLFIWLPQAAYGLNPGFNDLGVVGTPYSQTYSLTINTSGQIAGSYYDGSSGGYHEFIYLPVAAYNLSAGIHDLGLTSDSSPGIWMNDAGQVLINVNPGLPGPYSYIWMNGALKSFTTDYGVSLSACGINNQGQVLGSVTNDSGGSSSEILQIESDGTLKSTTVVDSSDQYTWPYFINNPGDVLFNDGSSGNYYLWDHTSQSLTQLDFTQLAGANGFPLGLNDSGQVLGVAECTGSPLLVYAWQAGTFTSASFPSEITVGDITWPALLGDKAMSGSHLAGTIQGPDDSVTPYLFHWSPGETNLDIITGNSPNVAAVNNQGQIVGTDYTSGEQHAYLWTPSPPPSSLTISGATVTAHNGKTLTVTVQITNPSTSGTAYNVTVTAASLDVSNTNSVLPLVYGAIKPGESKQCTLQFKTVSSGQQTLTVTGTCSLGAFSTTQTLTVP